MLAPLLRRFAAPPTPPPEPEPVKPRDPAWWEPVSPRGAVVLAEARARVALLDDPTPPLLDGSCSAKYCAPCASALNARNHASYALTEVR